MPSFDKGPGYVTPFGKREFLRSTQDVKTESGTVAASTITAHTVDGFAGQKVLQPGTVLARITSGDEEDKLGPFQDGTPVAAVNEIQTVTLTGATAGSFTLAYDGESTAPIAFDATAAQVKAALAATSKFDAADLTVTLATAVHTITFGGAYAGTNVDLLTINNSLLVTTPAVNEIQTITRTATGATFIINFDGESTAAIDASAVVTAAVIKAALVATSNFSAADLTVGGAAGGPFPITFTGQYAGTDVPAMTISDSGTGGTVTIAQTTAGAPAVLTVPVVATTVAGAPASSTGAASDGREDPDNIVGLNITFLPWQLMERDVEVAYTPECTAVAAWCTEYNAAGDDVVGLTSPTIAAIKAHEDLAIRFALAATVS